MKKTLSILLLFALLAALLPAGALAATRVSNCKLVIAGKVYTPTASTGYIERSGSTPMIPLKSVCAALGLSYSNYKKNPKLAIVKGADGTILRVASGYKYVFVGSARKDMRARAYMRGKTLMVDVGALACFGYDAKAYIPSAELKALGYSGAVLVIAKAGESLTPPDRNASEPDSFAAQLDAAQQTNQLVVVKYKNGSTATLSYHEKTNGHWRQLMSTTAYVGKNGIGKTREGDKKTPTGTFNLTTPFGIKADPGAVMPYTQVSKTMYWCGTSGDPYYNQLIDTNSVNRPRTSADEYLIKYTGVYNYCLFIDYNKSGEAGKGSCIFLHCTGSSKYTAGCIAIPQADMVKLLKRLGVGAKIVIM